MTPRRLHACLSILSAPTILFFALTGAAQLFDWHRPAAGYHPPALVAELAMLHKRQHFALPAQRQPAVTAAAPERSPPPVRVRIWLLRAVFLFAALSLAASSLLGIWMGLSHPARRHANAALLAVGVVVPLALIVL